MIKPGNIDVGFLLDEAQDIIQRSAFKIAPFGVRSALAEVDTALRALHTLRPFADWHEDYGDALWYALPIQEPPYVGSPLDIEWPGVHTHWTPLPDCNAIQDLYDTQQSRSNMAAEPVADQPTTQKEEPMENETEKTIAENVSAEGDAVATNVGTANAENVTGSSAPEAEGTKAAE